MPTVDSTSSARWLYTIRKTNRFLATFGLSILETLLSTWKSANESVSAFSLGICNNNNNNNNKSLFQTRSP